MSKRTFTIILTLGIASLLIILESCKKEDIELGRTALEYAYECESVLGPLPEFKYEDATEIPVTKDGVPLTHGSDNLMIVTSPKHPYTLASLSNQPHKPKLAKEYGCSNAYRKEKNENTKA